MKHSGIPSHSRGQHPAAQVTSLSLLARLRAGDEHGWDRLVRLYGPLVYNWCRRAGLSQDDAEDAVQDVFTAVSQHLERFRRDQPGDSFRKWLKTIAFNRARELHRRQSIRPRAQGGTQAQIRFADLAEPALDDSPPDDSVDEDESERQHLLRQATELVRSDFEPATWSAFWETAVRGRAAPDVAADLGITANAVRIAKSRVRARLREELDGLLD